MNLRRNKAFNVQLFSICIILVIFGCHNEKKNTTKGNNEPLYFDVSNWNKDQKIPENVIKEVKFIPLETKEDCLMGEIVKIISAKDKLYVLDRYNQKIFVFDKGGKYFQSIGRQGKGAGEYIKLNDFIVDNYNSQIQILSTDQRKVLSYDLQDGTFINEFKLDFLSINFAKPEKDVLSFYTKGLNNTDHLIAILNLKNNSYQWFLEKDEYDTKLSFPYSIFNSENTYYVSYFKDVVYRITKDDAEPFIIFDFGQNKIPKDKLKKAGNLKEIVQVMNEDDWTYGVENVIDNGKLLTFNFKLKKKNSYGYLLERNRYLLLWQSL